MKALALVSRLISVFLKRSAARSKAEAHHNGAVRVCGSNGWTGPGASFLLDGHRHEMAILTIPGEHASGTVSNTSLYRRC